MPPDPPDAEQALRVHRAALAYRVFLVAIPVAILIVLSVFLWLMLH